MLKKIILSVVVLVIVALAAAYFVRNQLVKKAVEEGSEYALGVETNLSSASLNIGGGSLRLNRLEIRNPEGFEAKNFMTLRRGIIDVDAGSVLDEEVRIDSLIIEGVNLELEQIDRKGNYKVLLDHIKQLNMSSSGESQKFRIGLIALRDIEVTGSLSLLGKKNEKTFKIDNISLRNIGSGKGATISQVTATIVKTLISRALAAGSGQLPGGFGANLGELKEQGVEKIKTEAEDKLKDLGKSLTGGKK